MHPYISRAARPCILPLPMPACRVLLLLLALAQLSVVVAVRDSEVQASEKEGFLQELLGHMTRGLEEQWQGMPVEPVKEAEELPSYTLQERMANKKEYTREELAEKRDGFLITCMLFGAIVYGMLLLYLLNSSDPQVKSYSYKMLSTGVIVFCALTVENLQHSGLQLVIEKIASKPHLPGSSAYIVRIWLSLVIYSLAFLGWFFCISIFSRRFKANREDQYCSLNLVLHICAFTALEMIGSVQEQWANALVEGAYSHTILCLYMLVPLVIWVFFRLCVEVSGKFRERMEEGAGPGPEHGHGHVEHHGHEHEHDAEHHEHHDWKHEAIHAESDALAIVVGFLIKQFIVYLITAHPAPMDCGKYPIKCKVGGPKILEMFLPALALTLVAIPVSVWRAKHHDHTTWILRLELLLVMTLSWVILQASEWVVLEMVWDASAPDSPFHSKTVKKLICASALSPVLFVVIMSVDAMADRGLTTGESAEATVQCIAFWIGFYWEKVFFSAIKNLTKHMTYKFDTQAIIPETLLSLGFLFVVVPAWRWFLVPVAVKPVPPREGNQKTMVDKFANLMSQKKASSQGAALQEPAAPQPALLESAGQYASREEAARGEVT